MNITLRKANALQTAIQDHLKTISTPVSISINEFQNPEVELTNARDALQKDDVRINALTKALYRVRAQVGRANADAGVSDLLADAAFLDKRLARLKLLTESDATDSMDVVKGKLDKIRNSKSDNSRIYGYSDTVTTGVLTADQIEGYKAELRILKKEKQSINDKVLELNVRTEITLDAGTVALLQAEQLV